MPPDRFGLVGGRSKVAIPVRRGSSDSKIEKALSRALSDFVLVNMSEQEQEPVELAGHLTRCRIRGVERLAEPLEFPGQLERELHAGEVEATLFYEILNLSKALDILVRVQPEIARGTRGRNQPFALILAQGLWVHLDEPRRDTDDKQGFGKSL
jgi:hypothetical protein